MVTYDTYKKDGGSPPYPITPYENIGEQPYPIYGISNGANLTSQGFSAVLDPVMTAFQVGTIGCTEILASTLQMSLALIMLLPNVFIYTSQILAAAMASIANSLGQVEMAA